MRINYHKSEIISINIEEGLVHRISHIFGCPVRSFPIKYLGVLDHYEKLKREDVQPLVDKIIKKVASSRGKDSYPTLLELL